MEETLKRLLDAERRAAARVDEALAERDRLVDGALDEVKGAEARFEARLPELRQDFARKAEARAAQTVAELERRHHEHLEELEELAARRRGHALELALTHYLES